MSDAYNKISKVWSQFPKELENSTLFDEKDKLKNTFEDKKYIFDDYLTKIVIIGNVSTGKTTLINDLLGKDYFGSITGNGTVSFFYCSLSEKKYEYFTVNKCQIEHKNISILKCASKLNVTFPDFIDENSVLKVYVKHDENKILERKTIIVDCPGLGYDERSDEEVKIHCSNTDLFIFMFQINKPPTLKQRDYIKTIRDNYRNPTFFFVFNKCDLPEFNDEKKTELKDEFSKLFGEQYYRNLKLNNEPLYFISALKPNKFEDFSRLITDILNHKNVNLIRFVNVQSILIEEVNKYSKTTGNFVTKERRQRITMLESIAETKYQMENAFEKYSEFLNYIKTRIDNGKDNLQINKIFNKILEIIDNHDGKCNKENAPQMISKIEENITSKVIELMEKHLKDLCIDAIHIRIQEINRDRPNEIKMACDKDYKIPEDLLTLPNYDVTKIFWSIESGDKTIKVKESYSAFVQANKKQINDSIMDLYKNEFYKIEKHFEELVVCIKKKHETKEKMLNEELKRFDDKLKILTNYEKEVRENMKEFNSSFV